MKNVHWIVIGGLLLLAGLISSDVFFSAVSLFSALWIGSLAYGLCVRLRRADPWPPRAPATLAGIGLGTLWLYTRFVPLDHLSPGICGTAFAAGALVGYGWSRRCVADRTGDGRAPVVWGAAFGFVQLVVLLTGRAPRYGGLWLIFGAGLMAANGWGWWLRARRPLAGSGRGAVRACVPAGWVLLILALLALFGETPAARAGETRTPGDANGVRYRIQLTDTAGATLSGGRVYYRSETFGSGSFDPEKTVPILSSGIYRLAAWKEYYWNWDGELRVDAARGREQQLTLRLEPAAVRRASGEYDVPAPLKPLVVTGNGAAKKPRLNTASFQIKNIGHAEEFAAVDMIAWSDFPGPDPQIRLTAAMQGGYTFYHTAAAARAALAKMAPTLKFAAAPGDQVRGPAPGTWGDESYAVEVDRPAQPAPNGPRWEYRGWFIRLDNVILRLQAERNPPATFLIGPQGMINRLRALDMRQVRRSLQPEPYPWPEKQPPPATDAAGIGARTGNMDARTGSPPGKTAGETDRETNIPLHIPLPPVSPRAGALGALLAAVLTALCARYVGQAVPPPAVAAPMVPAPECAPGPASLPAATPPEPSVVVVPKSNPTPERRMNLTEELLALARERQADVQEKKGVVSLKFLVAERKAFLSKKKLHYTFKFFVDEAGKAVRYEDMLAESGLGMSGGDLDSGPGFGFKTETYRVGMGQPREGAVQEQSVLFGQKYTYTFDFAQFRGEVERRAAAAGCRLVFGLK